MTDEKYLKAQQIKKDICALTECTRPEYMSKETAEWLHDTIATKKAELREEFAKL